VRSGLGVDAPTAAGILADGSFDISHTIAEVMDPLVKQIVISRDFVERRENCHMSRLYLSGGLTVSRCVRDELRGALELDVETWNPFEGLRVQSGAVPESCVGREWMFASAVGACLGTFEET
jgi:Tfp pilus assembly PilM family ATPase